jgi:hypothetical protein
VTGPDLSDAQRRLLAMVAERLPGGRVRELYLFAPIRQGGVETGLAVIAAAEPPAADGVPELDESAELDENAEPGETVAPGAGGDGMDRMDGMDGSDATDTAGTARTADTVVGPIEAPVCAPEDADVVRAAVLAAEASVDVAEAEGEAVGTVADVTACDPTEDAAGASPSVAELELDGGDAVAEPPAVVTRAEEAVERAGQAMDDGGAFADVGELGGDSARQAPERYTVYTARYRLQLKGPDRGKWAVELVAEADAPLLTVDAVVRGVQRRAGEVAEVERLTGPDLARLLGEVP